MSYQASCHCGAVEVTADGEIPKEAMACNCSHCRRKGFILAFVPADQARITRGADVLKTYTFNKHVIQHSFCPTCGVQPVAEGKGPDGSPVMMINLRCVDGADLDGLKIQNYDGASH
ncbi:MAG: GFA family protein [Sphingomicrobium sp.]